MIWVSQGFSTILLLLLNSPVPPPHTDAVLSVPRQWQGLQSSLDISVRRRRRCETDDPSLCPPPPSLPILFHTRFGGTPIHTSSDRASYGDGTCTLTPGTGRCRGWRIGTCRRRCSCLIINPFPFHGRYHCRRRHRCPPEIGGTPG